MIYKYITCEPVIAKIMSDLDIQDVGQRMTDIKEWIFEALDKIGAVQLYNLKESNTEDTPLLTIVNYQAQLPDDLIKLNRVAFSKNLNGPWRPMRSNTGNFVIHPDKGDPDTGDTTTLSSNTSGMDDNDIYPILITLPVNSNMTNFSVDPLYFLKPGYLVTNMKSGYLKLSYQATTTDSRGYPLVPDLESFKEALYWYVVMKLKYPEYLSGKMNINVYYDIRRSWNFYRQQAYGEAMMPNEDQMTSIKNEWLKLYPEIDEENAYDSNIGREQKLWNNYYGRIY